MRDVRLTSIRLPFSIRAPSPRGEPGLTESAGLDRRREGALPVPDRHRRRVVGVAVQEVGRAVERIHEPQVLGALGAGPPAPFLFGEDLMTRMPSGDDFQRGLLRPHIHIRHEVAGHRLLAYPSPIAVAGRGLVHRCRHPRRLARGCQQNIRFFSHG